MIRTNIPAPRGLVYDRHGKDLIYNVPSYNVVVYPNILKENPETWDKLQSMTGVDKASLKKTMKKNMYGIYRQAVVLRNINFKTNTLLNENIYQLPGVEVIFCPIREYSNDIMGGNILGYTAQIHSRDIQKYRDKNYKLGDNIGFDGIEKEYEDLLRGKKGYQYKQVNAIGQPLESSIGKHADPQPGSNLYLTLDMDLQAYAESLLTDKKGAAILMNYENGELLACVSAPTYDPDIFVDGLTQTEWDSIVQDEKIPLFNRVLRGQYPPGSIYKMIAVAAGLEKRVITPATQFTCTKTFELGGREFNCSHEHGLETLTEAIAHSCNIYFYNVILALGLDDWWYYGHIMGFGEKTNIDLPGEQKGVHPDRKFLDKRYGKGKWWKGTWLNVVIGQGDVLVTPLQAVKYAGILATRGKVVRPHLLKKVVYQSSGEQEYIKYPQYTIHDISSSTWREIEHGMRDAVQSSWGTGKYANVPGLNMYGKTGTAQNSHGDNHAWFLGYSKKRDFPYAVVVLVENGGLGGSAAAPLAGKLLKKYYYVLKDYEN